MKKNEIIDDWIDRDEVRALAEKLLAPAGERPRPLDDSVYGAAFEGFVEPLNEAKAEALPNTGEEDLAEAVPEKTEKEEVVASPPLTRSTQPNPFQKKTGEKQTGDRETGGKPSSPFRAPRVAPARKAPAVPAAGAAFPLQTFVTWLRGEIPLEKAIVFGGAGEVLFDDLNEARLTTVIRMLGRAAQKKKPGGVRSMVVKLGPGRVMQVISFQAATGPSAAGLVLPRPLADGGVEAFVKALKKALA